MRIGTLGRLSGLLTLTLALALPAAAQTLYSFGTVLQGENEVPSNASVGQGLVTVVYMDLPDPAEDQIRIRGVFDDLQGNYQASHLHEAPAGSNGPVVQALMATVDGDSRGGQWMTDMNTFPAPAGFLADLQAGLIYVNVHSDAFPSGELRGQLAPVPLLDGVLDDDLYQTLAVKQNNNAGFGPDIDVTEIVYYPDLANEVLFLGIKGKLNTASNDGIGLWLDFDGRAGNAVGNALGGVTNAGHYMGDMANPNFKADFEVDYMFAMNPGGGASSVFLDAVKFIGIDTSADYLGEAPQDGTVALGPPDDLDNEGEPAFFRTIAYAFNNAGMSDTGFELAIPFRDLGITVTTFQGGTDVVRAFAFVASSTAFFSDVTVPGNVTGGNLGFNPDFNAIAGGPYFSTGLLPVELTGFDAAVNGSTVRLGWTTVSETNNAGFEVQMDRGTGFEALAFIDGHGSTTEAQTYGYTATGLAPGTYRFRLKQVDFDGAFEYSDEVEATVGVPGTHVLSDAYPNPFNPQTTFTLAVARSQSVTVTVHDVLGRSLVTLYDGPMEGGQTRTFTLDGASLPSGTYTVRAVGEAFTEARRVTLLK